MREHKRKWVDVLDEFLVPTLSVIGILALIGFVFMGLYSWGWFSNPSGTSSAAATSTTEALPTTVTSAPTTAAATTAPPIADLEAGLFCRDLVALGYGYESAVAYWTLEGSPERMDADRNGIPCETGYDEADVLAYWDGPLPTTIPQAADTVAVATVVAWIQAQIDIEFAASDPPPQVLGPDQLDCTDTGFVSVGDVLGCMLRTDHDPANPLEDAGAVIYVLDSSGRAAWSAGTDVPGTTTDLRSAYDLVPHELFCRDLYSPVTGPYPFDAYGRTDAAGFFWSLVYWSLEGEPDRMDADLNGIPCETLYDADAVSSVLAGGPAD